MITNADSSAYPEEIPTLVVIFVGATITVLVLVTMLIIANAMKRKISMKTNTFPQEATGVQIKNIQVTGPPSDISFFFAGKLPSRSCFDNSILINYMAMIMISPLTRLLHRSSKSLCPGLRGRGS